MTKAKTLEKEPIIYRYSPLFVIIIPLILYCSALQLGLVYFDDDILILINYEKISNLSNIGLAFKTDAFFGNFSPYYRPLQTVSMMVDAALSGKSAIAYHASNLLYHLITGLGLLWLLGLFGFSRQKALVAALVFAVHPLMGHAVLWIPARGDLLVTLFSVTSFAFFLKFISTRRGWFLAGHILCFAAAVFSKESGVFLPLLFLLYLVTSTKKPFSVQNFIVAVGWIVVLAAWYLIRYQAIDHRSDGQVGPHSLVLNAPFIPEVIARIFLPFNLPVAPVFTPVITFLGIIFMAVIAGFSLFGRVRRNYQMLLLGIAWFLGFCLPNMFVRLSSANDSFEYLMHRAYLPSVGFIIFFVAFTREAWFDLSQKIPRLIIGILLLALSVTSFYQRTNYESATSFWGSAIAYQPGKAWYRYYLGRYYFKTGDNRMYEKYLLEAESLKSYPEFKYQLGMVSFAERKDYQQAYIYFTQAFQEGYADPEGRANFIALCLESSADFYKKGQYSDAVKRCEEALKIDPSNADATYNLGIYLVNSGEKQKAASAWIRSIQLNPGLTRAYRSLCLYYLYDAKKADSATWYAREYEKHGGTENLISLDNAK